MQGKGTNTGAQATATLAQLLESAKKNLRDGRELGLRASQAMLDSYSTLVSGVLIGMSDALQQGGVASRAGRDAQEVAGPPWTRCFSPACSSRPTSRFHILFPTISIALGWVLLFFRLRWLSARQRPAAQGWLDAYRFWTKVFALTLRAGRGQRHHDELPVRHQLAGLHGDASATSPGRCSATRC